DLEHALHRWLAGQVPDHYIVQVFGPRMLQKWQALLVSIVEESDVPAIPDESPPQPRPWTTNMHPARYIDGIATQEEGLSLSINRFRQQTMRAKLLHQSRLRPLEMEYQQSMGTNHLTDDEILPGQQARHDANVNTVPSTITPASTMQFHLIAEYLMMVEILDITIDPDPHSATQECTRVEQWLHHNIMITGISFQFYQSIN
ncbi:unnamed protein product, partial [Symbiodinium natans]